MSETFAAMPIYDAYKDSGVEWLGKIPEHWEVKPLGSLSYVVDPQPDHRAPSVDPHGLPYIGIRDVKDDGSVNIATARMVNEKAVIKQEHAFSINEGDIVFCKV